MFSIYTTLYNVTKNKFDVDGALNNFCRFAEEVCVAVPTNDLEDNTMEGLEAWRARVASSKYNSVLKIVECPDIRFSDNEFDGKLKNAALQATSNPVKINMDGDERIPLSHASQWRNFAQILLGSQFDALFVPSVDLWGNPEFIRSNHRVGLKWRMHKAGLYRGVVNFARLPNGKIDTTKSDTCELINANGDLASTAMICNQEWLNPAQASELINTIYTLHYGYLDFDYRININGFWKPRWEDRSGKTENVTLQREDLEREPVVRHNLPLE